MTSVASCAARQHEVFASAGQSVLTLDLRKVKEEKAGAARAARISIVLGEPQGPLESQLCGMTENTSGTVTAGPPAAAGWAVPGKMWGTASVLG